MRFSSILFLAMLLVAPAVRLSAADQSGIESRLREALRTTNQQLSQTQNELSDCKRQKDELDQKVQSLEKQASAAKQCGASRVKQESLQDKIDQLTEANQKSEASLNECKANNESKAELEKTQAELTQAKEELTRIKVENVSKSKLLEQAQDKNKVLYKVGRDLIDWISQNWSCSEIPGCDPFLDLHRVTLENIAQDYEDRLIEQKITP